MSLIYFPIIVSLFAIVFVWFLISQIRKAPVAGDKAVAITQAVQEGAMSYLKRQYKTVSIVAAVMFVVLLFLGFKIAPNKNPIAIFQPKKKSKANKTIPTMLIVLYCLFK